MKPYPVGILLAMSLILTACSSQQVVTPTIIPTATATAFPVATATAITTPTVNPSATATVELPISPTGSAYLTEALDIMQNNSLHRYSIDWEAFRTSTFLRAQHAQTTADTYDAIRYALYQLGDHHSFFRTPEEVAQVEQLTMSDFPLPRAKLLLDKLGFIAIPGFGSGNLQEDAKYATHIQQLIRDLDTQEPCGWIVDLRENTGGDTFPMLAGLGPVLGKGELGAFIDADGHKEIWSYQNGEALLAGVALTKVNEPVYKLRVASPPVAVLTGVNTGSAGESVVVAFRGRPKTRSFGLYTYGVPTGNRGFPLSDGAMIALTTVFFADRTGQVYGDRIYPDELVDEARKYTMIMDEAIPQPAIDWLMSQPECIAQK